jgi:RNA polymerase sigma-70 factor (ECF subfamily)
MDDRAVEDAIRRVQGGSRADYEAVVNVYQRRLRGAVAGHCPPGVDPDEIAHMAFVEAYKRIDQYAPGTRFYAWLAAIARNLLLNECRRIRREARRLEHVVAGALPGGLEAAPELDESRARALRECVSLLPAGPRAVLRMRYDRDTPLEAIARRIGKSLAAVKFQLFAIRRKLRECVERKTVPGRAT